MCSSSSLPALLPPHNLSSLSFCIDCFVVLGLEPRALCVLAKCSLSLSLSLKDLVLKPFLVLILKQNHGFIAQQHTSKWMNDDCCPPSNANPLCSSGRRPAQLSPVYPAYPADEARSQLTEIFEVKGTEARVQLPSQKEVIHRISWGTTESEGTTDRHPIYLTPTSLGPFSPEFPPGARAEAGATKAFA